VIPFASRISGSEVAPRRVQRPEGSRIRGLGSMHNWSRSIEALGNLSIARYKRAFPLQSSNNESRDAPGEGKKENKENLAGVGSRSTSSGIPRSLLRSVSFVPPRTRADRGGAGGGGRREAGGARLRGARRARNVSLLRDAKQSAGVRYDASSRVTFPFVAAAT